MGRKYFIFVKFYLQGSSSASTSANKGHPFPLQVPQLIFLKMWCQILTQSCENSTYGEHIRDKIVFPFAELDVAATSLNPPPLLDKVKSAEAMSAVVAGPLDAQKIYSDKNFSSSTLNGRIASMPSPEKLVAGVDSALGTIDEMLRTSKTAKEEFQLMWDGSLESYRIDIREIETHLAKLPPSYDLYLQMKQDAKHNAGRANIINPLRNEAEDKSNAGTDTAHHALNFHMTDKQKHNVDAGDIFLLPAEDDATLDSSPTSRWRQLADDTSVTSSLLHPRSKQIEEVKFDCRETMFQRMEEMRKLELQLEARLFGKDSTGITDKERKELTAALDRCRSHNSKQVISMVSEYRPRFVLSNSDKTHENSSENKMKRLGLNMPSLKEMLDTVKAEVAAEERDNEANEVGSYMEKEIEGPSLKLKHEMKNELNEPLEDYTKGVKEEVLVIPSVLQHINGDKPESIPEKKPHFPNGDHMNTSKEIYKNDNSQLVIKSCNNRSSEEIVCSDLDHFTQIQHLPVEHPQDVEESAQEGPPSLRSLVHSNTQPIRIGPARKALHSSAAKKVRDKVILRENFDLAAMQDLGSPPLQGQDRTSSENTLNVSSTGNSCIISNDSNSRNDFVSKDDIASEDYGSDEFDDFCESDEDESNNTN